MMNILSACGVILSARQDAVLVATMGSMGAMDALGAQQPRVSSVPLMGGAPGLGLGLALAHPERKVIVVDGDASLLMQLGNLVTVAANRPANLYHFLICNGTQFSGMSNLPVPGRERTDYCAMARAAGYVDAKAFSQKDEFSSAIDQILAGEGPRFIALNVEPDPPKFSAATPQEDWKDLQFTRMHNEAHALAKWLVDHSQEAV